MKDIIPTLTVVSAIASFGVAQTATAELMQVSITGPITDTFTFNDSAGIIDGLSDYLTFHLITDADGYNGVYFGDSAANGYLGAGDYAAPNYIGAAYVVEPTGNAFYSGTGTSIDFIPVNTV